MKVMDGIGVLHFNNLGSNNNYLYLSHVLKHWMALYESNPKFIQIIEILHNLIDEDFGMAQMNLYRLLFTSALRDARQADVSSSLPVHYLWLVTWRIYERTCIIADTNEPDEWCNSLNQVEAARLYAYMGADYIEQEVEMIDVNNLIFERAFFPFRQ